MSDLQYENSTVFVIDDDQYIREYVQTVLESSGFNVSTFSSVNEFLENYQPHMAGCILSDILMPDISGLELQEILVEKDYLIPIIFMTGHGTISMAKKALRNGAVDFIEKPLDIMDAINSIKEALHSDFKNRKQDRKNQVFQARISILSDREREILNLIMDGYSNKQIAQTLSISVRTIETHRANILKKMRANSIQELMLTLLGNEGSRLPS